MNKRNEKIKISPYRVSGIGYRVSSIGYRVSSIEYRVSSIEYRVSSIEYRVSSIEYRVSSIEPNYIITTIRSTSTTHKYFYNISLFSQLEKRRVFAYAEIPTFFIDRLSG